MPWAVAVLWTAAIPCVAATEWDRRNTWACRIPCSPSIIAAMRSPRPMRLSQPCVPPRAHGIAIAHVVVGAMCRQSTIVFGGACRRPRDPTAQRSAARAPAAAVPSASPAVAAQVRSTVARPRPASRGRGATRTPRRRQGDCRWLCGQEKCASAAQRRETSVESSCQMANTVRRASEFPSAQPQRADHLLRLSLFNLVRILSVPNSRLPHLSQICLQSDSSGFPIPGHGRKVRNSTGSLTK